MWLKVRYLPTSYYKLPVLPTMVVKVMKAKPAKKAMKAMKAKKAMKAMKAMKAKPAEKAMKATKAKPAKKAMNAMKAKKGMKAKEVMKMRIVPSMSHEKQADLYGKAKDREARAFHAMTQSQLHVKDTEIAYRRAHETVMTSWLTMSKKAQIIAKKWY